MPNPPILARYQHDAFSSGNLKSCEQAVNILNVCKTSDTVAETKNAASAAIDNGVKCNTKANNSRQNSTPERGRSAMAMYGKPDHKRVAKSLGFVLNQGTVSAWHGLTTILIARLSDAERAALAYATLKSLSDDQAYMTASVALYGVLNGEALA